MPAQQKKQRPARERAIADRLREQRRRDRRRRQVVVGLVGVSLLAVAGGATAAVLARREPKATPSLP